MHAEKSALTRRGWSAHDAWVPLAMAFDSHLDVFAARSATVDDPLTVAAFAHAAVYGVFLAALPPDAQGSAQGHVVYSAGTCSNRFSSGSLSGIGAAARR